MLLLLGCTDTIAPTADSTPANADSSGGWAIGPEQSCPTPHDASWTLQDDAFPPEEFIAIQAGDSIEGGGIALVEANGSASIAYARPNGTAGALDPHTGARSEITAGRFLFAFAAGDFDDNGATDLIVIGQPTTILWDWAGADGAATHLSDTFSGKLRDVAVGDFDGDADLDLVGGYTAPGNDWHDFQGRTLRNEGKRLFSGGDPIAAPEEFWGKAFDVSIIDLNGDNAPDVSFCNDMGWQIQPNGVLHNEGGLLTPVADAHGLDVTTSCMGAAWADVDGDGWMDEFIGDSERLWWLRGTAAGIWVDATATLGLGELAREQMAWGARIDDLDNDGVIEIIVPTSWFRVAGTDQWPVYAWSRVGTTWTDRGPEVGLPTAADVRSVLTTDINRDGVPDIILGDANRSPWVYMSDGCTADAWLTVDAPEGTVVAVEAGGVARIGRVTTEGSYASAAVPRAHFGLGAADTIDRITLMPPWSEPIVLDGPLPARIAATWTRPD